ncbi:hypothetical protein niasHT_035421 [Heterodera trifolii]|uniref:Glucosylceramidase n=1 Tax=Heterodera trifolii TaxID=157864 RepID=A0ABD2I5M5_9BILA
MASSLAHLLTSLLLLCFVVISPTFASDHPQKTEGNGEKAECQRRYSPGQDSFVCACDASHCDSFEDGSVDEVPTETLLTYSSDRKWKRLERKEMPMRAKGAATEESVFPSSDNVLRLSVDPSDKYQTILGFGGAFSDSSGINLNALSAPVRRHLLEAYFHYGKGIRYSFGRVPIASTDFSTRQYSYVDQEGDFDLSTFSLAPEDFEQKIPFIKEAVRLSGEKFRLFACPWSAPAWMKTNGKMNGGGQLKGELDDIYYKTFAKYLLRFFDEYAKNGVDFWALTIINQPQEVPADFPFQSMFMSNRTQREFAARILSPLLKHSPHTAHLKLLAFDDVREFFLPSMKEMFGTIAGGSNSDKEVTSVWCRICRNLAPILPEFMATSAEQILACKKISKGESGTEVIDGIGVHWYTLGGHSEQDKFHAQHPDKMIISTEACTGFIFPDDSGPRLGNWTRGWQYGWDIVQNLRHWSSGWVDWNLCLDMNGGPNWVHNYVDAPIIVNAERDEFYKQPMFYFLAHFSRFMPPGSVRIGSTLFASDGQLGTDQSSHPVQHVSVITPHGQKVLVLINSATNPVKIRIDEVGRSDEEGKPVIELGPEAIMTIIWK